MTPCPLCREVAARAYLARARRDDAWRFLGVAFALGLMVFGAVLVTRNGPPAPRVPTEGRRHV